MEPSHARTAAPGSARDAHRFGPSYYMVLGGLFAHPFFYAGIAWGAFALSPGFRTFLWGMKFAPWREALLALWRYTESHPWTWLLLPCLAGAHLAIRYFTSYFAYSDDYLYVQTGLFSFGSPGGPLRVFNDPIPFSTVLDANAQKGLLGLLTGTGTLFIRSSELQGKYLRLSWVPRAELAQEAILARAGVRNARILSSVSTR